MVRFWVDITARPDYKRPAIVGTLTVGAVLMGSSARVILDPIEGEVRCHCIGQLKLLW